MLRVLGVTALSGTLELDGQRVDLSGWLGYVDHTWGRFTPSGLLMQHRDWAVAEDATGALIVDGFESGHCPPASPAPCGRRPMRTARPSSSTRDQAFRGLNP